MHDAHGLALFLRQILHAFHFFAHLIEFPCLRRRQGPFRHRFHRQPQAARALHHFQGFAQLHNVARFHPGAIQLHMAGINGFIGLGTRFENACHLQPFVHPDLELGDGACA